MCTYQCAVYFEALGRSLSLFIYVLIVNISLIVKHLRKQQLEKEKNFSEHFSNSWALILKQNCGKFNSQSYLKKKSSITFVTVKLQSRTQIYVTILLVQCLFESSTQVLHISISKTSCTNIANIPFMSLCIIFNECKKVTPSNICFVYQLDSCSERTPPRLFMWSDNDPWRKHQNISQILIWNFIVFLL